MESTHQEKPPSAKICPLALPKGKEKLCELCERRACLQCTNCRVTFYCNAEHQQEDWVGIHNRICHLLIPIRNMTSNSLVETQNKMAELIDVCRLVAESKLSEGKHQEALPAALSYLRNAKDLHGTSTVQLVPPYLLLAEANMGLGNLHLVTELLSHAEWAVFKNPDCGHALQHQLHRCLGRLYTANGNLNQALCSFANDIYFASEEYGLDSTVASEGYFLMGNVFAKQGRNVIAQSFYSEAAGVWHKHLSKLLETHVENEQDVILEPSFDKSQQIKVGEMLMTMLEFLQNNFRQDLALRIALVAHCLATLWFQGGDAMKAEGFCSTALQVSQLIPNHDLTEPIQSLLERLQGQQPEPHPGSH